MNKVVSTCLLAFCVFSLAQAQTTVSGGIFSNTTWTKANSPYIVTGNVAVFPGAKLTIEPGVEVRFDAGMSLEVRDSASFFAHGLQSDSIIFTSNESNPAMSDWNGFSLMRQDTIAMSYCRIEFADYAMGGPGLQSIFSVIELEHITFYKNYRGIFTFNGAKISNSRFHENNVGIESAEYGSVIDNCDFIGNIDYGFGGGIGSNQVLNSYFCGNHIGIQSVDTLINCTFVSNDTGVTSNEAFLWIDNVFAFNNIGFISILTDDDSLRGNNSFKNEVGGIFSGGHGLPHLSNNNFCDNTLYDLQAGDASDFDLPNTCFCSNDSATIASKIYDGYDNVSLGRINFVPFVNCNNAVLPADPDTNCIDQGVGIGENFVSQRNPTLFCFPNPATDLVNIQFESGFKEGDELLIFSTLGQLEKKINITETGDLFQISLNDVSKGIHLIQLSRSQRFKSSARLLIQ